MNSALERIFIRQNFWTFKRDRRAVGNFCRNTIYSCHVESILLYCLHSFGTVIIRGKIETLSTRQRCLEKGKDNQKIWSLLPNRQTMKKKLMEMSTILYHQFSLSNSPSRR